MEATRLHTGSTRPPSLFHHQLRGCNVAACAVARGGKKPEVVVGIDLGTTNSAVAYIENGKPRTIPNSERERITPSIVTFLPDGEVLVGKPAKRVAAQHPTDTFYSVKRLIGRPFSDPAVQEELPRLAYKVGVCCHAWLPSTADGVGHLRSMHVCGQAGWCPMLEPIH